MASDEIINEIWEIAQENSVDPIDKEEFGRDLKKSVFAELEYATEGTIFDINNEFARALPIILHQAKVNPDLIYENNGKGFSVASGILAKAVLTVKYENRFIPGTAEYKKEFPKENVSKVVFTAVLADNLLKNYDNLSKDDKLLINDNWDKLTTRQRAEVFDKELEEFLKRSDISQKDREIVENVRNVSSDTDRAIAAIDELEPDARDEFSKLYIKIYCEAYPEKIPEIEALKKNNTPYQIFKKLDAERVDLQRRIERGFVNPSDGSKLSGDHLELMDRYKDMTLDTQTNLKAAFGMFERKGMLDPSVFDFKNDSTFINVSQPYAISRINNVRSTVNGIIESDSSFDLDGYLQIVKASKVTSKEQTEDRTSKAIEDTEEIYDTVEYLSEQSVIKMIKGISEEEVADLFGDELKELLSQRAEELGLSDDDKKILEAMMASKDDDSFADLFYEDRDGFIQELEEMAVAQQLKKIPVTDQEYSGTYRSTSVDMAVDEPGLEAAIAQIESQKKAEAQTELDSEADSTDTSSDTTSPVQNDNEVGEGASTPNKQPVQGSFIMTARREDSERDAVDGEGAGETSLEDEAADSIGNTNNSKANFSNFKNVTQKFGPTTDMLQEMGNTVTTKLREQDSPELANDNGEVEQEEIE